MIQKPLRLFLLIFLMANSAMAENKELPKDQKPPEHTSKELLPVLPKEPVTLKKEPLKIIPDQRKRPRQIKKISAQATASLKALKITIPTTAQKMAAKRLIRLGRKNFTLQELRIAERLVEMGHTHFTDSQMTAAERLVLSGKTNFSDLDLRATETPLDKNKTDLKPPLSERRLEKENNLFPKTQKIKTPAISLSRMFSTPRAFENAQAKKKEQNDGTDKSDPTYFSISQEKKTSQAKQNDPFGISPFSQKIKYDPKEIEEYYLLKKYREGITSQLGKLGQTEIRDADILLILKFGQTGRKIFDAITADRKNFSRINSLDKIRQLLRFTEQHREYFRNLSDILSFAKRVNQERLCLDDLPTQCGHVMNTWKIMKAKGGNGVDLENNDLYEEALEDRFLIYEYIKRRGGNNRKEQDLKTVLLFLKKAWQEKIIDDDVLFILGLDQTKRSVFESLTSDQKTFGRINSLNKLRRFIQCFRGRLPNDRRILLYAKRINQEHLCLDDISAQFDHVRKTFEIMKLNHGDNVDLDDDVLYEAAMEDRALVYRYITQKGGDNRNYQAFAQAILDLKKTLNLAANSQFKRDEDLSISAAMSILDFQKQIDNDREMLWNVFFRKKTELMQKAPHMYPWWQEQMLYSFSWRFPNLNIDTGLYLMRDKDNVEDEIDKIAQVKSSDPLGLHYQGLTYDDYFSAVFSHDFNPVSTEDVERLRQEALNLVEKEDFDDSVQESHWNWHMMQEENHPPEFWYRKEINQSFDRILNHRFQDEYWKERVAAIFTKVPEALVEPDIARPGTERHNPTIWKKALKAKKKIVLQHIVGAMDGCNTGVAAKLRIVEEGYRQILTSDFFQPKTPLIEPIANIIRKIKMERIQEMGNNPFDGYGPMEANLFIPSVAMQRIRLPFSIMANYEDIVAPTYGQHLEPQNSPIQLVRNLFLPAQPDRHYHNQEWDMYLLKIYSPDEWQWRRNNSYLNYLETHIPVAPHLTVKSLVDMVYEEFDKSITWKHLNSLVNGELTLRKDRLIPVLLFDNGVFVKTSPPGKPTAKGDFSKNMAFYLLEKMNYVKIQPHIKDKVYQYDEETYAPGAVFFQGQNRTLEELIDLF